jgi:hypothetical protein
LIRKLITIDEYAYETAALREHIKKGGVGFVKNKVTNVQYASGILVYLITIIKMVIEIIIISPTVKLYVQIVMPRKLEDNTE